PDRLGPHGPGPLAVPVRTGGGRHPGGRVLGLLARAPLAGPWFGGARLPPPQPAGNGTHPRAARSRGRRSHPRLTGPGLTGPPGRPPAPWLTGAGLTGRRANRPET